MKRIQLVGYPHPVPVDSIVWLQGEANYTRVHFQNGTYALITQSLQWFEHHLDFVRVHRSAIINPIYVQEFGQKPGRSGWVTLTDNQSFTISRNRLEQTIARLNALQTGGPPTFPPNE